MANASGFFTPSIPSLRSRRRIQSPIEIYQTGFYCPEGFSLRVFCSNAAQGSDKLASGSGASSSESRAPRLVSQGCKLVGCGSAVPTLKVSNDDLAKIVDTSDEWISARTGIRNRRVLAGKDSLTTLAVEAGRKALQMAQVDPDDVDLVLMCTSTPEDLFGSAPQACDSEEDGLFGFDLHSDGDGQRHLNATIKENEMDNALGSNGSVLDFPPKQSSYSCIKMNGNEVFRFAVRSVPHSIESALEKAGLPRSSIDWLLLHQANQRIIDAVATRLEVPPERVISNLANYGNTSAASIPLALDEAVRSGKVKAGHTIAAAGFGAGLTWGSAIVRWR
ncbi:beta-ketoacyl-[acyl-carrier-protein] synthase III, chloroplastic isoform X2 [Quercus suber]|uniref:beta-ketoacyl-[acyl-carrier-protein] synthase III, chloroplastic isoform X2 n=1 Tax=Quercus suber TaxID=58331 RepID=UPI0032DF1727